MMFGAPSQDPGPGLGKDAWLTMGRLEGGPFGSWTYWRTEGTGGSQHGGCLDGGPSRRVGCVSGGPALICLGLRTALVTNKTCLWLGLAGPLSWGPSSLRCDGGELAGLAGPLSWGPSSLRCEGGQLAAFGPPRGGRWCPEHGERKAKQWVQCGTAARQA